MPYWNTLMFEALRTGSPSVLVTVISQSGSTPRSAGARMIVLPDGSIRGTIGGGKFEGTAMTEAVSMLGQAGSTPVALAKILFFSPESEDEVGLPCGGSLHVLLELVVDTPALCEVYRAAANAEKHGLPHAFVTELTPADWQGGSIKDLLSSARNQTGAAWQADRRIVLDENTCIGAKPVPLALTQTALALGEGETVLHEQEGRVFLLESFPAPFTIHIFGGGHVAKALADVLHPLGFHCIILEDRPAFLTPERFPNARLHLLPDLGQETVAACLQAEALTRRHGIIIMTRGHTQDRDVLAAALDAPAGYLGMIGSRKKGIEFKKTLLAAGADPQKLDSVYTPIGLAIAAETPEEIAISIAAELIAWKNAKPD